jgi:hypothetical protein
MRRTIWVMVIFAAGFAARGMWNGCPIQAEGDGRGAGTPSGNGDVNGDGRLDLSDPVYTLQHLFLGGPEPVPIECQPAGFLATAQTKCFDVAGAEIACDSTDLPGQDGFYRTGCATEDRFVDHQDGTVSDTCTGLVWQKETADVDGNGSSGSEDHTTWQGALKYCDRLVFAGHDDWRLPDILELESIVDHGRSEPSIDPAFAAVSGFYWSSTTYESQPGYAWHVDFIYGIVNYGHKPGNVYVRAVRGGS